MPVTTRAMSQAAGWESLVAYLDISGTTPIFELAYDPDHDIEIKAIKLVYAIATDGGTRPESLQVGIPGALTTYADVTPAASTAVGTVTSVSPTVTTNVAAGTPLIITRSAATGGTNTGEVALVVFFRRIDP